MPVSSPRERRSRSAPDDDIAELLLTMAQHKVRRLPVIDGHTLVGMIALADLARQLEDPDIGLILDAISRD